MKIGFLAMSGIRAHDPKLLELGLTLPGFVERSKTIASLPSLGLLYLAACTPEGHDLRYFEAEADGQEPRGSLRRAISSPSARSRRRCSKPMPLPIGSARRVFE